MSGGRIGSGRYLQQRSHDSGVSRGAARGLAGVDYELARRRQPLYRRDRRAGPPARTRRDGYPRVGEPRLLGRNQPRARAAAGSPPDEVLIANPDVQIDPGCGAGLMAALNAAAPASSCRVRPPRRVDRKVSAPTRPRHRRRARRRLGGRASDGSRHRSGRRRSSRHSAHDFVGVGALLLASPMLSGAVPSAGRTSSSTARRSPSSGRAGGFPGALCARRRAWTSATSMHEVSQLGRARVRQQAAALHARTHGPVRARSSAAHWRRTSCCGSGSAAHRRVLRALVSRDALTPGVRP